MTNLPITKTFLIINRSIFKDTINSVFDTIDICQIKFEISSKIKQHHIEKAFRVLFKKVKRVMPNYRYWSPNTNIILQEIYSFALNKKDKLSYIQMMLQTSPNFSHTMIAISIYKMKNYNLNITALPDFSGKWFVKKRIIN